MTSWTCGVSRGFGIRRQFARSVGVPCARRGKHATGTTTARPSSNSTASVRSAIFTQLSCLSRGFSRTLQSSFTANHASLRRPDCESGVTLIELLIAVTLLSLLSVGMLFAMRVGLNAMGKTNDHFNSDRRVLGVERILTEQIAGFVPATGLCSPDPQIAPSPVPFFQGEPQTMRFVSTYSLQEAARGYPRILEFQVIPGENGQGVRLIVNEHLYTGPLSTGILCAGTGPDPVTRA